ncbi:MAG: ABC transporter ATP-binding protein [Saprospiraceae bacterium]|nr:ABC transporter ATP-binding protein [Saprospiraceae bacterium]
MPTPLLQIKNLVVEFKSENGLTKAVNNISFSLPKGKTIGIVGESGSGKSVTSLSVMRLIPTPPGKISNGEIIYTTNSGEEVDLLKVSENDMRHYRGNEIAMIFQEPMTSLNPVHKCGKQVMESILTHQKISKKEAKAKTIELFNEVLLPEPEITFHKYPHQISGGQKQRVMIAMAISCNPAILIADEPTTALDVTVQKTILQLMKNLQQKYGMGIIFITHDLGVIAELADEVVVMYKGEIVEQGNVKDIFLKAEHPYTKGLLACRPPLDKRLKLLPTVSDFLDNGKGKTESLKEFSDELIITDEERKNLHKKLYSSDVLVDVQNLSKWFTVKSNFLGKPIKSFKAVNNVNFNVYPGETLGLVGESGCGKTTLGRTILRMIEPTSGKVIYKNRDLNQLKAKQLREIRKKIQIIFQDPYSSLNPRITVGTAIIEPMVVHKLFKNNKERKHRAIELLERVGLNEGHYSRYPHEFSGGQRQRICIARTLVLNPEFIICDESVSALDVSVQAQVLNLLNELKKDFGFTYIFISHDLSVVKFMSDRMIVMNKGEIEESGDADEIYFNPKTEYTKKLIDAIPKGL